MTEPKVVHAGEWVPPNRKRLVKNRKNFLVPLKVDFGIIQVTPSPRSRVVMLRFTRPDDPKAVHLIFNPRLLGRVITELGAFLDDAFEFGLTDIDVEKHLEDEFNEFEAQRERERVRNERKRLARKLDPPK